MLSKLLFIFIGLILCVNIFYAQPYQVGHISMSFYDPARNNREVSTEIYYPSLITGDNVPVAPGVFPYLVFGHGFLMGASDYTKLSDSLVSEGYIVIYVTTCMTVFTSDHETFRLDLAFISSIFYSLNSNISSSFYGKIIDKKAIIGHSMGGGCTVLAAQNNPNINAIICLSPLGTTNPSAISVADLVNVPALIIGASGDSVCPANTMGIPIYDSLSSTCKVFISIIGGGHCLFGNNSNGACSLGESASGSSITITNDQQNDATLDFMIPWLNYHLKNDQNSIISFFDSLQISPRVETMNSCLINSYIDIQDNSQLSVNCFIHEDNLNIVVYNVTGENLKIQIIDVLGKVVYNEIEQHHYNEEYVSSIININQLNKGIYIVKICDDKKMKSLKIIK
ncbi:MAG: T9SS type A sorting domain-containing protein [Bacteroidales bacterium]|nr:T9SS type A sorting domain-containing protein [Bacteroidales bacterium]